VKNNPEKIKWTLAFTSAMLTGTTFVVNGQAVPGSSIKWHPFFQKEKKTDSTMLNSSLKNKTGLQIELLPRLRNIDKHHGLFILK